MPDPRLVFVLSPYQNAFFPELAAVLAHEAQQAGVQVLTTTTPDRHEVAEHDVFVVMPPHELAALEGRGFFDDSGVAARTIGISAEQPHQAFFDQNVELGARLGAVIDFSALAVEAYRARGVAARHLAFGYTSLWDRFAPGPAPTGPPHVLYMGNPRPRRLAVLASVAPVLARHRTQLLISDNSAPNLGTSAAFVAGDDKRDLLRRTRLLINVHQSDEPYFEWLRFAEAAHCGTPMLSEVSVHTEPFVAGEHFESFERHELGHRIEHLLADDALLAERREAAYGRLREHPLANSIGVLIDTARDLLRSAPPAALPAHTRTEPLWGARRAVTPALPLSSIGSSRRWRPGGGAPLLVAPVGTQMYPGGLDRMRELLAPEGTAGPVMVTAMYDGLDASGGPTLEGIRPWDTWRLTVGQHLGQIVLVRADVARAARSWTRRGVLRSAPHVALAAWVAAHGGEVAYVPSPVAHVSDQPLDATQQMDPAVAAACRDLLEL